MNSKVGTAMMKKLIAGLGDGSKIPHSRDRSNGEASNLVEYFRV